MRQQIKEFLTFLGLVVVIVFVITLFAFVCLSTYESGNLQSEPLQNRIIDAARAYVIEHLTLYSIALLSAGWLSLAAWSIFKDENKRET